jgi:hypothetical protein
LEYRQDEDLFQDLPPARKDILLDKYILIIDYFQYKAARINIHLMPVRLVTYEKLRLAYCHDLQLYWPCHGSRTPTGRG